MKAIHQIVVGDSVRLTGVEWGPNQGKTVTVDQIDARGIAWNTTTDGVNSLTTSDGQMWTGYEWVKVEPGEPERKQTGYAISLYISKNGAGAGTEVPAVTELIASIELTAEDLDTALVRAANILDTFQEPSNG